MVSHFCEPECSDLRGGNEERAHQWRGVLLPVVGRCKTPGSVAASGPMRFPSPAICDFLEAESVLCAFQPYRVANRPFGRDNC